MRRILYSVLTMLVMLPVIGKAQEQPTAMSIDDCIDYALKNQAKMKNAYLDQKSTLSKNREVVGQALPNLKATASINYAPLVAAFQVPNFIKQSIAGGKDPSTGQTFPGLVNDGAVNHAVADDPKTDVLEFAFQPKWTTQPQLELSQLLFEPNILVALQGRKVLERIAQRNLQLTAQEVRIAVIKAYYDVLIASKRKILIDQNLLRIGQLESETREVYKNGLAEKIDVDRITVNLNNLKTEKIRINQVVALTYMALKFQMGMDLQNEITLTDSLDDQDLNDDLLSTSFQYSDRVEYSLLEEQRNVDLLNLKRYRLGAIPTLSLFGNYGYTLYNMNKLFDPADKWQNSALVGVKLSVPIFDGFQRRERVKQAKYELQKNDNDFENLRLSLDFEKESASITYQNNVAALKAQNDNMQLAEEVYRMAQIKYREGVGSSLEVVNAESDLKESQTNYFSALYDAITARTNLLKALGKLN